MTQNEFQVLRDARRIVKVGSSLVTNEGRGLDEAAIGEWSRQLAALVRRGARSSWSPAAPLPRA
jgi:glutamate 5-kinase